MGCSLHSYQHLLAAESHHVNVITEAFCCFACRVEHGVVCHIRRPQGTFFARAALRVALTATRQCVLLAAGAPT